MFIIYRLYCNITGLSYIGITEKTIQHRLKRHIGNFKTKGCKDPLMSEVIIKNENYGIEELDRCETRLGARILENAFMELFNSVNKNKNIIRCDKKIYPKKKVFCKSCNKDVPANHLARHRRGIRHLSLLCSNFDESHI